MKNFNKFFTSFYQNILQVYTKNYAAFSEYTAFNPCTKVETKANVELEFTFGVRFYRYKSLLGF